MRGLNVLIGANATGKSNIVDALAFLCEAVRSGSFERSVTYRGGLVHLAWKGEEADVVGIETVFRDTTREFRWVVEFLRANGDFFVKERLYLENEAGPPSTLLEADDGQGWWWSDKRVELDQDGRGCALSAASADADFDGRAVAAFVRRWGFFDPSPALMRRASALPTTGLLENNGRNLASRLYTLEKDQPEVFARILKTTRAIVGVPSELRFRVTDDRVHYMQNEPGLEFAVHQVGTSSGTLRILAYITALLEGQTNLIGIEEPENYVHPSALEAFVAELKAAADKTQVVVTTHSPLFLDFLETPENVLLVRRDEDGTQVYREDDVDGVRVALTESGFGLGEYYQTKGFGG